jgi:hypothetical protein
MDPLVIPVLALMIPMIVAPAALVMRTQQRKRELEHAERMRALELGRILPSDESWWSPPRVAVALGVIMPFGALLTAVIASDELGAADPVVWGVAGLVGLGGVGGGTLLAAQHFAAQRKPLSPGEYAKAPFDPDAYDVVGSRG